ncbi:MAG: methylglyoxal synthase [Parasporobacterium sp.]|nr:methylglyoxal synthase [Parasporobacterium sp.]
MNIGLISHDSKKELMQNFCIAYKNILSKHNLFATGNTGRLIEDVTNLNLRKFIPGQLGGSRQMCAQIEVNEIDAVIFLRDPLDEGEGNQDYLQINRLCDLNSIPIATNIAAAEILILAIDRGDLNWRNLYR